MFNIKTSINDRIYYYKLRINDEVKKIYNSKRMIGEFNSEIDRLMLLKQNKSKKKYEV